MNPVVISSAIKTLTDKSSALPSGEYKLDYMLSLLDNETDDELVLHCQGVVTKGEEESVTPTTSIPWVTVAAELLRSCGVTGESAVERLREAISVCLLSDKTLAVQLKERHKSVAEAVERIKKDLLAKLPKVSREGKTVHSVIAKPIVVVEGSSVLIGSEYER